MMNEIHELAEIGKRMETRVAQIGNLVEALYWIREGYQSSDDEIKGEGLRALLGLWNELETLVREESNDVEKLLETVFALKEHVKEGKITEVKPLGFAEKGGGEDADCY